MYYFISQKEFWLKNLCYSSGKNAKFGSWDYVPDHWRQASQHTESTTTLRPQTLSEEILGT